MNTNDLPPAAKLAALIEAGRATNPGVSHGYSFYLRSDHSTACALGFAFMGSGISREDIVGCAAARADDALARVGLIRSFPVSICLGVTRLNDGGASLEEICHSLREGALAKLPA